jgi:thioesterase domain-containing protein/acyl carrier protein
MSEPTEAPVGPRSRTEQALAEIWRQTLELDRLGVRDDFFELGGDSVAASQVLVAVQREFGRSFPLAALFKAPTVEAMAELIERAAEPPHPLPGRPPAGGTQPPFFCVHGVGGDALAFVGLARRFSADQPFYAVRAAEPAGPERRPRVEEMAFRYLREVRAVQPRGPYRLGGYSFGGSVALEMAQPLRASGEAVALLAVLDHTPPPVRYRRVVWSPALPFEFAVNAARWVAEDLWRAGRGRRLAALRRLARSAGHQFLRALRRAAPSSGKEDADLVFGLDRLPEQFRRTVEAHYQALRDHAPQVHPGRVAVFRAPGPAAVPAARARPGLGGAGRRRAAGRAGPRQPRDHARGAERPHAGRGAPHPPARPPRRSVTPQRARSISQTMTAAATRDPTSSAAPAVTASSSTTAKASPGLAAGGGKEFMEGAPYARTIVAGMGSRRPTGGVHGTPAAT